MQRNLAFAIRLAAIGLLFLPIAPAKLMLAQTAPATTPENQIADAEIDKLRAQLKSPDPNERAAAVEQLSQLGERAAAAIPQLVELLGDRRRQKAVVRPSSCITLFVAP